mmetsp:Transcript_48008/g.127210  ORF Transcript_48008/g.127210 Transcript_48008/m.127210 type:complete len:237 (-) Transcript_48008:1015-1725(-)
MTRVGLCAARAGARCTLADWSGRALRRGERRTEAQLSPGAGRRLVAGLSTLRLECGARVTLGESAVAMRDTTGRKMFPICDRVVLTGVGRAGCCSTTALVSAASRGLGAGPRGRRAGAAWASPSGPRTPRRSCPRQPFALPAGPATRKPSSDSAKFCCTGEDIPEAVERSALPSLARSLACLARGNICSCIRAWWANSTSRSASLCRSKMFSSSVLWRAEVSSRKDWPPFSLRAAP